jgi:hypothetical protein
VIEAQCDDSFVTRAYGRQNACANQAEKLRHLPAYQVGPGGGRLNPKKIVKIDKVVLVSVSDTEHVVNRIYVSQNPIVAT